MENVTLRNGVEMPMEGFGVFQIPPGSECESAVASALDCGYRMIDTAAAYMNEEAVGAAIRKSGIAREDIFVTTKLWVQDASYEKAKRAFEVSLRKLGLDYLDLYLVHQPMSDYYGAWRAMEELYRAGRIRAIGVCNFYPERLADLCLNAEVAPMVDQIECHPFFQRTEDRATLDAYGVQLEAWGPLAEGGFGIFDNEVLSGIAAAHDKSVAQVVLRWNVQRGVVVIPKSVRIERMRENQDIWDFELTDAEMKAISSLDTGRSGSIDHSDPDTAKWLNGFKIHG